MSSTPAGYLLDTNYVSELVRLQPDARALAWIDSVDEASLFLSVITLAEIRKVVDELAPGTRRTAHGARNWTRGSPSSCRAVSQGASFR